MSMAFVLPLLSPSILFSLFLTFRMYYSLPLYLTLSILLHLVIPGGEDGDRRQGMTWRLDFPFSPLYLSLCFFFLYALSYPL